MPGRADDNYDPFLDPYAYGGNADMGAYPGTAPEGKRDPRGPNGDNTPPSSASSSLRAQIIALYQQYLKRTPSEEEIRAHIVNPRGADGVRDAIFLSPEYHELLGKGQQPPGDGATNAGAPFGGNTTASAPTFSHTPFTPPAFDRPEFDAPAPFEYPEFVGPTADTFQADPGYDFRVEEMERGIKNFAGAEGMLRTGNTLTDLMKYRGGLASQEFGNVFNRQFNTWQANRGSAAENYDRLWRNKLTDYTLKYEGESDEFNRALATHETQFGGAATAFGLNQGASANRFGQLLDLYKIATRGLPTYTPSV